MMPPITLIWVGGEHPFALTIGRLRALQTGCDAGPEELLNRIRVGNWKIDDLIETIRQGLIGAGMETSEAGPMVTRLFELHGAFEFKMTAFSVLQHALSGVVGDPVGKPEGQVPEMPQTSGVSLASTVVEP